jgi:hypothetical protein
LSGRGQEQKGSQNVKQAVEAPGPSDASDPSDRAHH